MAVIYVDLRIDLLNNTVSSVRLLGEVLNRQQRAEQFIEFYQQHMAVIRQRLAGYQGPKPKVMLHLHLGRRDTCCTTAAHGNLGDLLTFAGGDNIANASVKGVYGELNPETILSANPDVYLATGMAGPQGKRLSDLRLGPQVSQQDAADSFRRLIATQPMLASLQAVKHHRARSVWHNFTSARTTWCWSRCSPKRFTRICSPTLTRSRPSNSCISSFAVTFFRDLLESVR